MEYQRVNKVWHCVYSNVYEPGGCIGQYFHHLDGTVLVTHGVAPKWDGVAYKGIQIASKELQVPVGQVTTSPKRQTKFLIHRQRLHQLARTCMAWQFYACEQLSERLKHIKGQLANLTALPRSSNSDNFDRINLSAQLL